MSASDPTDAAPPQTEPALRAIAMPADANPAGDIFGGWLLSQMDLAGAFWRALPDSAVVEDIHLGVVVACA